ncbi:Protocatechuate 3,4-dioxygenase beta chain [hydrothermal vent metagenome]|uniref:Protocatechuate 3,4-dioxygenase beta chain n=1 Tax=hydrothermal vent metagenome TaxID=652676 RepID=A0A3B0YGR9_9ZZZZ
MNRRNLLKITLASVIAGSSVKSPARSAACTPTPPQTEGPFYPIHQQIDKDLDLTQIRGHTKAASGKIIIVEGQLQDKNCKHISHAKVEIWQANQWGRYQHKNDPNKAAIDPDFQGWGITNTDSNGKFQFKTILPGAYPATPSWIRPPHIHFKISHPAYNDLTTQIYFEGQLHNSKDRILLALNAEEQKSVVTQLQKGKSDPWPRYRFNAVLT